MDRVAGACCTGSPRRWIAPACRGARSSTAAAWNGGSTILLSTAARRGGEVWAFDWFAGLPAPSELDGRRAASELGGELVASEQKLREGFERFARIRRASKCERAGSRRRSEATAGEIGPVAVLHCDGDWFDSVLLTLDVMYPLVSPGGFIVIDDYGTFPGARAGPRIDSRLRAGETAPLRRIDHTGRYWQKRAAS